MDMFEQPDKVLAACEALMPHLLHVALITAPIPTGTCPIGFWMHRGCVPFVSPGAVRVALLADAQADHRGALGERAPDALLRRGQLEPRTWTVFAELPDRSIVYHVDQGDIFEVHRKLGDKFCLSGGIPNVPAELRHAGARCATAARR